MTEDERAGPEVNVTEDKVEEKDDNFELGQDCFQLHQEDDNTKDGIGDQMTGDQRTGDQMITAGAPSKKGRLSQKDRRRLTQESEEPGRKQELPASPSNPKTEWLGWGRLYLTRPHSRRS